MQASPLPPVRVSFGWLLAFVSLLAVHCAVALIGWKDTRSVEQDFRQAQTALSTYFIQQEHNYRLDYPTPVLGRPWSIPMEFPLYEWTVAKLETGCGWPLEQTGRGVSLACFYLTLPAWFLLLGTVGLPPNRRLAVLMVVLTCPIYLFGSRAFLIESMALMFASWHAWCVVESMQRQRWRWLVGAWAVGIPAALVKVTTWATVLIPCALYGLWLLWSLRPRRTASWQPVVKVAGFSLAAVLPALVAGWWWVRVADQIKAHNPAGHFLESAQMLSFNFGTLALRTSGEFWATLLRQWTTALFPLATLVLAAVALLIRGPWRGAVALGLAGFLGSQLLFANLYFAHTYYFYANGFLLAGACGLLGCHLLDWAAWPRALRLAAWLLLLCSGAVLYVRNFLPQQRWVITAASGLNQAIVTLTKPNDVIVVMGEDWSSSTPFAVRRRALMIPAGTENEEPMWSAALGQLAQENVALLLVSGDARRLGQTLQRRLDDLAMLPSPLFSYQNHADVYVRRNLLHDAFTLLRGGRFDGVDLPPMLSVPPGEQRFDPRRDRAAFVMMTPFPVRYRTPYGAAPWFEYGNRPVFLAHSPTELEFAVPWDATTLTLEFGMITEAYTQHRSDGVEIVVESAEANGARHECWRRRFNPRDEPADRPLQTATIRLPAGKERRLYISTLPGPAGDPSYDWVYFSQIVLRAQP
jgi:hypothetical protein